MTDEFKQLKRRDREAVRMEDLTETDLKALRQAQDRVRRYVRDGFSLVDILRDTRRQDAAID